MHYLKCKNCQHLNEVKTEYLTFCSNCNKKLDNNFSVWKKSNPDKSLEDFKQLICISEEEIQRLNSQITPKKPRKLKYWIAFAFVFAFFYGIAYFFGETVIRYLKSEKTSKEVLDKKWTREAYGNFGLTVETPVKIPKSNMELPARIKQYVEIMDYYVNESDKGFKIVISSMKYKSEVGELSLQGGADGAMKEMKNQSEISDLTYTEEELYKDDVPGIIQKGTLKISGINAELINTIFLSGHNSYQVMVLFQSDDDVGRIAANRVIESIEIKANN
ncbi:MAG: hypothetical protein K9J13_12630 [Saprospiraceae bacterium]|nr:hypothetical protein [Saprospiraceae bacterium]